MSRLLDRTYRCEACNNPVPWVSHNNVISGFCDYCKTHRSQEQLYWDVTFANDKLCHLCHDPLISSGTGSYRDYHGNYRHFTCPCVITYRNLKYGESMSNALLKPPNHPSNFKLGKSMPKFDKRTLKLHKYTTQMAPPPNNAGYIDKVRDWGMMLNDNVGDCTCATAGHDILQWSTYAGKPFKPTDQEILRAYQAVSGYNPNDPNSDVGANVLDVLKYWRKTGIGGHKITAFMSVNPKDRTEIMQAVQLFGNCYIGVGLPISAQDTINGENGNPVWSVPSTGANGDGAPYSWGGHAIPIVGYGADTHENKGVEVVTWGQLYDVTWGFLQLYCDEAFAILSPDWFDVLSGNSPSGFNSQQLLADLAQFS